MSDRHRTLDAIRKQWYEQQFVRKGDIDTLLEAALGAQRPDPEQMELVPAVSTLRACQKFAKLIDAGMNAYADKLPPAVLVAIGSLGMALAQEVRQQHANLERRPLAPGREKG